MNISHTIWKEIRSMSFDMFVSMVNGYLSVYMSVCRWLFDLLPVCVFVSGSL